jgi:hypothetical protein
MAVIAENMIKSFRFPVEAGWGAGGFPLILSFCLRGLVREPGIAAHACERVSRSCALRATGMQRPHSSTHHETNQLNATFPQHFSNL